jgi:2-iminobutanoate/2-iminopropanoate deaminase
MNKMQITVPDAASPVGPYSAAIAAGDFVFFSGQVPLDADGHIAGYAPADQARKALDNLKEVVSAAGLTLDAVVKTTIFLTDMDHFAVVNSLYAEYFSPPYPARSTVQVAGLPKGVMIEIEAIALKTA